MQIVIDIPEKTVNEIKDNAMFAGTIPSEILWDVSSAIVNGIPLTDILDNIIAEIKALSPKPTAYDVVDGNPIKEAVWETLADVLQIIDKYKAEIELQKSEE